MEEPALQPMIMVMVFPLEKKSAAVVPVGSASWLLEAAPAELDAPPLWGGAEVCPWFPLPQAARPISIHIDRARESSFFIEVPSFLFISLTYRF